MYGVQSDRWLLLSSLIGFILIRPSKIDFIVCVQGVKLQCGMRFLHRKNIDAGDFSYTKFCTMQPLFPRLISSLYL